MEEEGKFVRGEGKFSLAKTSDSTRDEIQASEMKNKATRKEGASHGGRDEKIDRWYLHEGERIRRAIIDILSLMRLINTVADLSIRSLRPRFVSTSLHRAARDVCTRGLVIHSGLFLCLVSRRYANLSLFRFSFSFGQLGINCRKTDLTRFKSEIRTRFDSQRSCKHFSVLIVNLCFYWQNEQRFSDIEYKRDK